MGHKSGVPAWDRRYGNRGTPTTLSRAASLLAPRASLTSPKASPQFQRNKRDAISNRIKPVLPSITISGST